MLIYVIRHATAEASGGSPDADRCLTAKGREEARRVGIALRKLGNTVEVILSSPAVRAFETAGLIASELNPNPPVEKRELLYGAGGPQDHLRLLDPFPGRSVALVGHMPDVGQLVATVTRTSISFRPSAVCCVDLDGGGRLVWHRTPEDLAALAGEEG